MSLINLLPYPMLYSVSFRLEAALGIGVRRWTQRRLLYPLAIFAIIAPTVILGLFGAYALREIELRPTQYRTELRELQQSLEIALEMRLRALSLEPPPDRAAVPAVALEAEKYFADFNHALASACLIGVDGKVVASRTLKGEVVFEMTPALSETLRAMQVQTTGAEARRQSIMLPPDANGKQQTWMVHYRSRTKSYVAWLLIPGEIERLVNAHISGFALPNDALSLQMVDRAALTWNDAQGQRFETLGFVPVHRELMPNRYVVLKIDTDRQFYKDSTLLSSIFVVIAVLCVPIVASATLMVVHMILREASEARKKVDFVSNVTHELKTPLTSIRMFVETLKLGRVKDENQVKACLDVIMTETDRLGALIDHVLSFSKVENQVKKYNMQPNNLAQVVRDTVGLFKAQATNEKGEVRLKMLPGLPSQAMFDKDAIREVVLNLLSNAIKYGGSEKLVFVNVGVDRNDLFIEVADRGIGIPQDELGRIFDKFYRVDQELSRNVDGTGLGLAICKEIVQAHGGRIAVTSVLRKGSTFTVYVPYRPPKLTAQKRPTTKQVASGSRRDTKTVAGEAA